MSKLKLTTGPYVPEQKEPGVLPYSFSVLFYTGCIAAVAWVATLGL